MIYDVCFLTFSETWNHEMSDNPSDSDSSGVN